LVERNRAKEWGLWRSRLRSPSERHDNVDWEGAYQAELAALPDSTSLLQRGDPDYPDVFYELTHPPEFVYWRGPQSTSQRIGMIGTRDPDHEGTRIAQRLAADIARTGCCVVSGGARGIDAACHQGALNVGGTTIVVLPSALDRASPRSNSALFERVLENGGALVSEYPLSTPVRKHFFARRNALIAALSDVLIVVRARSTGGSHLTVDAARRLSRPVFAVPGSPDDPSSAGCLDLIRSGDTCIWRAEHLGLTSQRTATRLKPEVQDVYDALIQQNGCSFDELRANVKLSVSAITRALLELELSGLMVRHGPSMHALSD
jgi:DNA processing protein